MRSPPRCERCLTPMETDLAPPAAPDRAKPLAALRGLLERPLASYYLLLASVGLLLVIGLVMVFSATSVEAYASSGNAFSPVSKQLVSAAIGLIAFWICQRLPARTYRGVCRTTLGICIALIVLLDVLGFIAAIRTRPGEAVRPMTLGPVRADDLWLYFGPVQIQPSELAKLALVLWGADVLVRKGLAIGRLRELVTPLFLVAALLFVLVGYNDFGTMICLLVLFVGLLWAAGVRVRVFAAIGAVLVAGTTLLILLPGKKDYRLARLQTFLDPAHADPQGHGYQFFSGL